MFYYSFTFKFRGKQHESGFPPLKPGKTIKLALKKLHNLLHNSPILSHNLPGKYRTISDFLLHLIRWPVR